MFSTGIRPRKYGLVWPWNVELTSAEARGVSHHSICDDHDSTAPAPSENFGKSSHSCRSAVRHIEALHRLSNVYNTKASPHLAPLCCHVRSESLHKKPMSGTAYFKQMEEKSCEQREISQ